MVQTIKPQPERVRRIKEEKERQGKSVQQIIDDGINMKVYASPTTLYRVFAKGSENVGFRDSTLQAVEEILGMEVWVDDEKEDAPAPAAKEPQTDIKDRIIVELHTQLKSSRRAHLWKNASIAFLTVLLVALLAVDRVLPEVGWYGTAGTAAWWVIASLLLAFILSVVAFHVHLLVYTRAQNKHEADWESRSTGGEDP